MADLKRQVGQRIRGLREKKQWSQEKFADLCGLHRTYLGSVERGERNLTLESLHVLARTLGVRMADIFGANEE
jgi:transcriptional regulator with XRE-family HTH domain